MAPDDLRLVSTSETSSARSLSRAWNYTTEVDDRTLRVDDPDQQVREARWFTADEAVALLVTLPYAPLAEPVLAHLRGEHGTRHWAYAL